SRSTWLSSCSRPSIRARLMCCLVACGIKRLTSRSMRGSPDWLSVWDTELLMLTFSTADYHPCHLANAYGAVFMPYYALCGVVDVPATRHSTLVGSSVCSRARCSGRTLVSLGRSRLRRNPSPRLASSAATGLQCLTWSHEHMSAIPAAE